VVRIGPRTTPASPTFFLSHIATRARVRDCGSFWVFCPSR
jgi:hypothetical protein